jgi:hypothetical protein
LTGERVHLGQFRTDDLGFRFKLGKSRRKSGPRRARLPQALFESGDERFVSHQTLEILDWRLPIGNKFLKLAIANWKSAMRYRSLSTM